MSGADLRRDGEAALAWAASYLDRVRDLPVLARVEPGEIRAALPASPPEEGEPFSAVLEDLERILVPGLTHWQSPRFFGYFPTTASEPGILAELLAATMNQIAFLWRTSPASTELEAVTLDWLAQLLGLPPGWHGHIEDTASTSTMAALVAARHHTGRNAVLCSEHAHSSVDKAARMLGMELRKIPADSEYRMRTDLLGQELAHGDVACVVATLGTTSAVSFDPLPGIADLTEEVGAWLHVDAAYAGAAWSCPELRSTQAGVERADSLVVNPHKWLFVPMDCSCLWSRRPEVLRSAFSLVPEYLRTEEDVESLSEFGPALGRRFRSLKLWAVLRCYGRSGIQQRIREAVRLAALFESWVGAEPGWELVAPRHLSLVCFRREASDAENEALLARVNRSGEVFLSHTKLDGRYVLRLAVGHERTSEDDVRLAWDVLRREAQRPA